MSYQQMLLRCALIKKKTSGIKQVDYITAHFSVGNYSFNEPLIPPVMNLIELLLFYKDGFGIK